MNFVYPTFLFALAAIAIPIIIHLFSFRRYKKVYFTNVRFLRELKEESESKSRLKEWLILILRILAITFLVFAFAQPFLPGALPAALKGNKIISVYVDNSFSMEALNKQGTLLDNAKRRAMEIANAYGPSDKFQLLTNDFEGRHQRLLSKEDFIEQLNDVKISPAAQLLSNVLIRQNELLAQNKGAVKFSYLLSDFQKNSVDLEPKGLDTSVHVTLIPIRSSERNNVYIDSCWFETPVQQYGMPQKLHVSIVNHSDRVIENGALKLYINNEQITPASFNAEAESKTEITVPYTIKVNGPNFGKLHLEDHPVTFDDDYYFAYNAGNSISALVIQGNGNKSSGYWRSLMQQDSLFHYAENNENAIDYSLFPKSNFIVLNELSDISSGLSTELNKFLTKGGSILIFPPPTADPAHYSEAMKALQLPSFQLLDTATTRVDHINFEQGLYEGVFDKVDQRMDLPVVKKHFSLVAGSLRNSQVILKLQNGDVLLSQNNVHGGKIYLFTVPLDEHYSNLAKHALFVPTVLKIAINSLRQLPLQYLASGNAAIEVPEVTGIKEEPLHISKSDSSFDIIPENRVVNNTITLFTQNQILLAGHYNIVHQHQAIQPLAFNYSRLESDMRFATPEELQQLIESKGLRQVSLLEPGEKTLTAGITELGSGKKLWKLFLILSLIMIAAEIAVIRLFK